MSLKQRVDQYDREIATHRREIAAVRKLILTGMRMINSIAVAQRRNEVMLKDLMNSVKRGSNGHTKRKWICNEV